MAAAQLGRRYLICKARQEACIPQQQASSANRDTAQQKPAQKPLRDMQQHHASSYITTSSRRSILGLTAIAACTCCTLAADAEPFTYGHQDGPPSWGGTCSSGTAQSPVNISMVNAGSAGANGLSGSMSLEYKQLRDARVTNSGHGAQVNVQPGNVLRVGKQEWVMKQYHFHTPSEHAINGRHADMELHFVHKNEKTGELAVLAVMLDTAPAADGGCAALQQALQRVPSDIGAKSSRFDLAAATFSGLLGAADSNDLAATTLSSLLGAADSNKIGHSETIGAVGKMRQPWVHYTGSLTTPTPDCLEGVQWFVLTRRAAVAPAQVLAFQRLLGGGSTLDTNARPVQLPNNRQFDYEGFSSAGVAQL